MIFLTVNVTDPTELKIDLKEDSLNLETDSDYKGSKSTHYELHIDFFKPIDVENSKYFTSSGNHILFVLRKKEAQEEFWPRLTKEKLKLRYIKTDFDKWVDEDEQDEQEEDPAAAPGGMPFGAGGPGGPGGAGGMPDMSALMGGAGGAGGMPDLSALMGGAGGAGGAGGMPDLSALMGGAGGAGGMPDFSKLAGDAANEEFSSSDDEEEKKVEEVK